MSEPEIVEELFGGPGPEDMLNASAALGAALRQFGAVEAQAAAGLRACLPTPAEAGPLSDVRRARSVAAAAAEAATRAALLLEAGEIVARDGSGAAALAAALAEAAKRLGLPPASLAPAIRAAALALPTDDASARIAAAIRAQELANHLSA